MKFKLKAALAVVLVALMALAAVPVSALPRMEAERTAADNGEREIWDGSIATSFAGGTGTEDDPYLIANGAQLAYLAQQVNSGADIFYQKYLKLTADIYLNDTTNWESWGSGAAPANEWTPIGLSYGFHGILDGNGHTVYGMYIYAQSNSGTRNFGLFGAADSAEINNLKVYYSYINVVGSSNIGMLAGGCNYATNCISNGKIVAEASYDADGGNRPLKPNSIGGVIGAGIAWKCDNYVDIFASDPSSVGGIIGRGSADYCTNYGEIEVAPTSYSLSNNYDEETYEVEGLVGRIGGIAGEIYDAHQCINKGAINVRLANWENDVTIGGIVCSSISQYDFVYMSNSYNAANINITIPEMLVIPNWGTTKEIEIGGIGGDWYLCPSLCYNSGRINIYGDIDSFNDGWDRHISVYAIADPNTTSAETCYYIDADCYTGDEGGIALTDAQMRDKSSFAGFDFHNIWTIEPATAYPYPQLIRELDKSMGGSSAIWSGNAASGFASGNGTQSDPYIINTAEQLAYLAKSVNEGNSYEGKFIKLNRDISLNNYNSKYWTLNATPWMPIGTEVRLDDGTYPSFKGSFNGNCHTIFGAFIAQDGSYESMKCRYWGLFGICTNATISNLNIRNSFVDAPSPSFGSGCIAGEMRGGTIENCSSAVEVSSTCDHAGGIVGRAFESAIESCYNTGTIFGENTGGIIGWANDETNILNCYNTGTVIGMESVGGIVGQFSDELGDGHAKVSQCYNIGRVLGRQYYHSGEVIGEALRWDEPYDGNYFIQNGYYLDNCCADGNGYGTALTDAQLRNQGSYAGFDFSSVWTMQGNDNYPYAELRSNPHGGIALPGDIDGNGSVSVADAISTLRLSMGIMDGSGMNTDAADMDGNGNITLADAIVILRIAMGLALTQ